MNNIIKDIYLRKNLIYVNSTDTRKYEKYLEEFIDNKYKISNIEKYKRTYYVSNGMLYNYQPAENNKWWLWCLVK